MTIFLIATPVAIFCGFIGRKLMAKYSDSFGQWVIVVAVLFTIYVSPAFYSPVPSHFIHFYFVLQICIMYLHRHACVFTQFTLSSKCLASYQIVIRGLFRLVPSQLCQLRIMGGMNSFEYAQLNNNQIFIIEKQECRNNIDLLDRSDIIVYCYNI